MMSRKLIVAGGCLLLLGLGVGCGLPAYTQKPKEEGFWYARGVRTVYYCPAEREYCVKAEMIHK